MSDPISTLLSFGDFELDTGNGELRKAGARIQLKSQQIRLLVLLATRAGEVVSREEIRQALWDGETFVEFDQSINVAVNKIRNALGDDPQHSRFIETLPRKGYRFIALVASIEAEPRRQGGLITPKSPWRTRWLWLATAAAIAITTSFAVLGRRLLPSTRSSLGAARFVITTPSEHPLNLWGPLRDVTLSPDGRTVAYRTGGSQTAGSLLAIRSLNRLDVRAVEDAEWVYAPFFSPDSRWIAFFSKSELKKVPVSGGRALSVCEFGGTPLGASWDEDNAIIFATGGPTAGLWRVSANGGTAALVASPERVDQGTYQYAYPSALPHGRGVVFTVQQSNAGARDVAVLDFRTGRRKTLIPGASDAQYVDAGYLLFIAGTSLQAVRFDSERLQTIGDPVTLGEDVLVKPSGLADYAVSRGGTLAFAAAASGRPSLRSLVWVDRDGREEPLRVPPRQYGPPRISPDGRRVAVGIEDRGDADVWIFDLEGAALKRLTFAPGSNGMPLWTPDARRLIFSSRNTDGVLNLYSQEADGAGGPEAITSNRIPRWPSSVMPDGKRVFGFDLTPQRPPDVVAIQLDHRVGRDAANGAHGENPAEESLFQGSFPEISPDGRFLAYQSNESGQSQVYLRPFPNVQSGAWQISTTGGTRPAWGRNGRELFFLDRANAMTAVPVQTSGPTLVLGTPVKLFDGSYLEPNPARHYDVSPDSKRFLMMKEATGSQVAATSGIVVVINWLEELSQRAAR